MSFLDGTSTVKNPLHFLSVNHHPCTSCSLSSDVPRISPDAITTPAAIHASVSMLLPFLSFVLMRNRKNHPNNNYLGNMTLKSACPGIKRGRHLHSLKIVEIFHIELIWYISGVHNWPFLTFIVSRNRLTASVGVSFSLPFGQYWHTAAVVSPHPLGSSVLAWPSSVCFPFLGFLVFSAVTGPHL